MVNQPYTGTDSSLSIHHFKVFIPIFIYIYIYNFNIPAGSKEEFLYTTSIQRTLKSRSSKCVVH
jgi:hypothetical protein